MPCVHLEIFWCAITLDSREERLVNLKVYIFNSGDILPEIGTLEIRMIPDGGFHGIPHVFAGILPDQFLIHFFDLHVAPLIFVKGKTSSDRQ